MAIEYKQQVTDKNIKKCEELMEELPAFISSYVISNDIAVSPATLKIYLHRIKVFFNYLHNNNSYYKSKSIKEITTDDLGCLTKKDIDEFVHYIKTQSATNKIKSNKSSTINNYLSALSSLWEFMLSDDLVDTDPIARVKRPKRPQRRKHVIRLQEHEVNELMECVINGNGLSNKALKAREKSFSRDFAIISIFLGTGIRISELVGLDVDDIDLVECCFKVIRKGHIDDDIDTIYFEDDVKEAIKMYLEDRPLYQPVDNERALFLVSTGKYFGQRLSERSVENIVKKYVNAGVPTADPRISPHKLRATFASQLMDESGGDLELVRESLGHTDPHTTLIYIDENDKRKKAYFRRNEGK